MRKRFWVAAGAAALAGLITAGVLFWTSEGLSREVTFDPGGQADEPRSETLDVVFDDFATDVAYLGYVAHYRHRLVAVRAGDDEPLWNISIEEEQDSVVLAMADGLLLVLNRCSTACAGIVAIDPKTGKRLWASPVSAGDVLGATDGHVAVNTSESGEYTGEAGLDLHTGKLTWRTGTGYDRFSLVPGTTRLAHYAATGALRLLDIATGRAEAEIEVPPAQNQPVELSTTTNTVVLNFEDSSATKATIYSSTDLTELWASDNVVYPLSSDRFYMGGGVITGHQGRRAWQTPERVRTGVEETVWGYTQTYEGPDVYRTRYVELAAGRQLADDLNTPAHLGRAGVLQADSFGQLGTDIGSGESLRLWYVELPSGDRGDLGTLEVFRETCAFSDTHLACLDTDRRFGMWSYT